MKVRGTLRPNEIEIMGDWVLVATNITPYEEVIDGYTRTGYEYDCKQYSKDEYLLYLARENAKLQQDIIDTQLALVELYEAGEV